MNPTEQELAAAREIENFCDICCARKVLPPEYPNDSKCQCKGLQPYAMSNYPGEHCLTESHPNNGGQQWYKRSDVDAKIDELSKHNAELRQENERLAQLVSTNFDVALDIGELKQQRDQLSARVMELDKASLDLLNYLPTKGDCLDQAALDETGMSHYHRTILKFREAALSSPSNSLTRLQDLERKAKALDWLDSSEGSIQRVTRLCRLAEGRITYLEAIESAMKSQGEK